MWTVMMICSRTSVGSLTILLLIAALPRQSYAALPRQSHAVNDPTHGRHRVRNPELFLFSRGQRAKLLNMATGRGKDSMVSLYVRVAGSHAALTADRGTAIRRLCETLMDPTQPRRGYLHHRAHVQAEPLELQPWPHNSKPPISRLALVSGPAWAVNRTLQDAGNALELAWFKEDHIRPQKGQLNGLDDGQLAGVVAGTKLNTVRLAKSDNTRNADPMSELQVGQPAGFRLTHSGLVLPVHIVHKQRMRFGELDQVQLHGQGYEDHAVVDSRTPRGEPARLDLTSPEDVARAREHLRTALEASHGPGSVRDDAIVTVPWFLLRGTPHFD
jgi:hypothetical protein